MQGAVILPIAAPCNFSGHSIGCAQKRTALKPSAFVRIWLQVLLVGLDHLLDHLAAHGTGLAGGQVAVVAFLQVDAHLLRCVFTSKI